MKRVLSFLVPFFWFCIPAFAQAPAVVDHWKIADECFAGIGYYVPDITTNKKVAKGEIVMGHPTGGCFEITLSPAKGGRGFVRMEAGRRFVFEQATGKILRLAECNNRVFGWVPFPSPPVPGQPGQNGRDGKDGEAGPAGRDGRDGKDAVTQGVPAAVEQVAPTVVATTPVPATSLAEQVCKNQSDKEVAKECAKLARDVVKRQRECLKKVVCGPDQSISATLLKVAVDDPVRTTSVVEKDGKVEASIRSESKPASKEKIQLAKIDKEKAVGVAKANRPAGCSWWAGCQVGGYYGGYPPATYPGGAGWYDNGPGGVNYVFHTP